MTATLIQTIKNKLHQQKEQNKNIIDDIFKYLLMHLKALQNSISYCFFLVLF